MSLAFFYLTTRSKDGEKNETTRGFALDAQATRINKEDDDRNGVDGVEFVIRRGTLPSGYSLQKNYAERTLTTAFSGPQTPSLGGRLPRCPHTTRSHHQEKARVLVDNRGESYAA